MKKDDLCDLLEEFICDCDGPPKLKMKAQLIEAGIDTKELSKSVDNFLENIAEKYGED